MSEFITKVVIKGEDGSGPAIAKATKGIQNYAKAANAAQSQVRTSTRQSRAAFTQLSYQVQDISVQLQAGQSPFIVLAQQGSQVASIFGPGGAVIGALLAVGGAIAGNLLPNLFKGADSLDEMRQKAEELGYELEDLAPLTAALFKEEEVKKNAENVKRYESELAKIQQLQELIKETQAVKPTDTIGGLPQPVVLQTYREQLEAARLEAEKLNLAVAEKRPVMSDEDILDFSRTMLARNQQKQAELQAQVNAAIASAATPQQKYNQLFATYNQWLDQLVIDYPTYLTLLGAAQEQLDASTKSQDKENKAVKDRTKSYEELVAQFRPALALGLQYENFVKEIAGYGLTEAEVTELKSLAYEDLVKKLEELGKVQEKTAKAAKVITGDGYQATALEQYANAAKDLDTALEDAAMGGIKSIEDGFVNMINGSQSVADSFRSMARSIVNDLIRIQIQRSITGPLAGMMGNFFGNPTAPMYASTAPTATGSYIPMDFAGGGYTGSGVRAGGLDGKGGFMAMVHPNETVIDHETGTGGVGTTVVNNINISTGVQQTVRAEIQNLLPQITQATKQAVADSRQRGGGFSKAMVGA